MISFIFKYKDKKSVLLISEYKKLFLNDFTDISYISFIYLNGKSQSIFIWK